MSRIKSNPLDWIGGQKEQEEPKKEVKVGRPKTIKRKYEKSSQEGLPEEWTRATFIIREDLLEKLKDYAWTERKTLKDTVNLILEEYLEDKEIIERTDD